MEWRGEGGKGGEVEGEGRARETQYALANRLSVECA